MTFGALRGLKDDALLQGLRRLVGEKGRADAAFVAHLAEVEERRLHLEAGFSSLFGYCVRGLGLSESEAFHRLTAARLVRRFPPLLALLETRALTLSAACLLRDHLTPENHAELFAAATHKSKREVEELLAARFPAMAARATIRKLSQRITPRIGPLSQPGELNGNDVERAPAQATAGRPTEPSPAIISATASLWASNAASSTATALAPPAQPAAKTPSAAAHPTLMSAAASPSAEPLSTHRAALFRVQFDATAELKAKLETAAALLSHANPRGDFAVTLERALDVLIEKLEKQRFAKTPCPRRVKALQDKKGPQGVSTLPGKVSETGIEPRPIEEPGPGTALPLVAKRPLARKHIPNEVRRTVVERDGACCSYVAPEGQRCGERAFLQLHHEEPWARGGPDSLENLRLLCGAHNRMLAERDYGRAFMTRALAVSPSQHT